MSNKLPELYKYHEIQFKSLDMAAVLMYCVRQSKHIDTPHLMDLQDPNAVNSSLYMINAAVNSLKINYDEETDAFSVDYPSEPTKLHV